MTANITKKRDAVRTRQAILEAAITAFSESGIAGTRVDDIATRAGVNKSLIYQHFGSKSDLYAEALHSVLRTITEKAEEHSRSFVAGAAQGDMFAIARQFLDSHLALLESVPQYPRMLAWENLEGGRTLARLPLQQTYAVFLDRVKLMLQPLARQGVVRPGFDLRQAAQAVIALTHYFMVYRGVVQHLFQLDPHSPQVRAAWVDYCARILIASLQAGDTAKS